MLEVQRKLDEACTSHAEQHRQYQKQIEDRQRQVDALTVESQQHREQQQGLTKQAEVLQHECDSLNASQEGRPAHTQQHVHILEQRLAESEAREKQLRYGISFTALILPDCCPCHMDQVRSNVCLEYMSSFSLPMLYPLVDFAAVAAPRYCPKACQADHEVVYMSSQRSICKQLLLIRHDSTCSLCSLEAEQLQGHVSGQRQAEHPLDDSLVDELMAEVEHLRQEKADVEAQADDLALSLAAERRRNEQVHAICSPLQPV